MRLEIIRKWETWLLLLGVAVILSVIAVAAAGRWAAEPPRASARPNILFIVADDLGYSDLGAFGGEIQTPHLDALARRGVRLTQFYTAPTCSPTRAMLLTGRDHHEVGVGTMEEIKMPGQDGRPGYEGVLNRRAATLAERLRAEGYRTAMAGKWHLGTTEETSPAARGFERSFVLLRGGHNHFGADQDGAYKAKGAESLYREDGRLARYPVGAYSSDYFTTRLIEFLEAPTDDERPFFAYLAFSAPHQPLQAPAETIAKYKGRYDAGPAALRAERLARMKKLGVVPADAVAYPAKLTDWSSLSPEKRALEARKMEVYAAMVDRMDQNVGRVIEALRKSGKLDNTLIVFLSDNGPEAAGVDYPISMKNPGEPIPTPYDNSVANLGAADSAFAYGRDWGHAAAAPSRGLKAEVAEGGIRTAAFVAGPGVRGRGLSGATLHVLDIVPTVLELTGTPVDGQPGLRPEGASWARLLAGEAAAARGPDAELNWELFYQRAARQGRWKAVYLYPRPRRGEPAPTEPARWQLYDLVADPGEINDLAAENPRMLARMVAQWEAYAARVGIVEPPGDAAPAGPGG